MADVDIAQTCVALLGSADNVDLNVLNGVTNVYTVPTGMKCVLHHIRIRNLTATATSCTCTVGQTSTPNDFLTTQTLSGLNAVGATAPLMPVPNATPIKGIEYVATTILVFKVTAAAGIACKATVEFFGTIHTA